MAYRLPPEPALIRLDVNMSVSSSYLRQDWGTAIKLAPSLWRLRLNNPRGHLLVNTYVYSEDDILAIVDPGWPWSLDALSACLQTLGLATDFSQVTHWLYTHAHVDHMGSAALLSAQSDAPHHAYEGLTPQLHRWHDYQDELADWSWWIQAAFCEPARSELLALARADRPSGRAHLGMSQEYGRPVVGRFIPLRFGQRLQIGSLELEVIDARGHDPHHIAFFERSLGWLFSGDVILPIPTPLSPPMHDDLALYEASLTRLSELPATLLLPGHGVQIAQARIAEAIERSWGFLRQHRRACVKALLDADGGPLDLYNLAISVGGEGRALEPASRWWVHLALTQTHLDALIKDGEVVKTQSGDGPLYWL